ncbi:hypothetical protein PCASD_18054 [Puccinia coronata f. sp. avenae]|uniref:Uncharacterized protein n=1 Tax=Puccinia coronata f. sp. avenae TaxID=200324 RepID=A0A2N5SSH6_9BASI|nr:hypothetical protein PCASD_18054 [Puccinia coronata f. sp. avenae]
MAEFEVTEQPLFVNAKEVLSSLNLQHNCHNGNCQLTKTRVMRVERQDSQVKAMEVAHEDNKKFILNSCSLQAIKFHRRTSGLKLETVEPLQWLNALHDGLNKWKANKKKGKTIVPVSNAATRVNPAFLI